MKKTIFLLFFLSSFVLKAATYYVAPNGNDNNAGTITEPWATWQKGFNSISPGDILYIRGGTYYPYGTTSHSMSCAVAVDGKKGSPGQLYQVFAYPGEKPVLDCRNLTSDSAERIGILIYNSDYWYLKGLEITRADQCSGSTTWGGQGLLIRNGNYNKIESIVSHHNGGPGFGLRYACEENYFINCDAYLNFDPYSGMPGDDADGYDLGDVFKRTGNERKNYLFGCRSWLNGDDGYDLYQHLGSNGYFYIENCWAWQNGYRPDGVTKGGNGCGFKMGATYEVADDVVRRVAKNCISYANRTRGYSQESSNVIMEFYNNIAYKNGLQGFAFIAFNVPDVLKNNISLSNTTGDAFQPRQTMDHNSWQNGLSVTDADFMSVDGSQLERIRKSDGSLPDIDFLKLKAGSGMIDAGINVGIPFIGKAPDLGPFESGFIAQSQTPETTPVPTTPLNYLSSEINDVSPSQVDLSYNLALASVLPEISSFEVKVNTVIRNVTKLSISDKYLYLTLATPVTYGDVITVSYTKPATNPLQGTEAALAESIKDKQVLNNVKGVTTDNPDAAGSKLISIFPNPVKDYIQISNLEPAAGNLVLKIFDFAGKLCKEIKLGTGETQRIGIDLKPGMYVVQLLSGTVIKHIQKMIAI